MGLEGNSRAFVCLELVRILYCADGGVPGITTAYVVLLLVF